MACVLIRLASRPPGTELAAYRTGQLEKARSAALPPGCSRFVHSQPVERAYRHGEPAFDVLEEHYFDELASARAFLRQNAQAPTLLASVVPVKAGPAPTDALKHVELLRRRPDLDRAAFLAYWSAVHGPIAAAMPAVLRYHQCHVLPAEGDASVPPFDGVAMLWFASVQAMRDGAQHPAFARAREDMPAFMDPAGSSAVLTQELVSISR